MRDYIQEQIAIRDRELAELGGRRLVLEAEMNAYSDLLRLIPATVGAEDQVVTGFGGWSPMWRSVLVEIVRRHPRHVTTDDLLLFLRRADHGEVTRGHLRSRLHDFVKKHLAERVANGAFRATDKAVLAVNAPLSCQVRVLPNMERK